MILTSILTVARATRTTTLSVALLLSAASCRGCIGNTAAPTTAEHRFASSIRENLPRVPDAVIRQTRPAGRATSRAHTSFRTSLVTFARQIAAGEPEVVCQLAPPSPPPFRVTLGIYHQGELLGLGDATEPDLCVAVKNATRRSVAAAWPDRARLSSSRFAIELPGRNYSLVELGGRGVELSHGLVPVRELSRDIVLRSLERSKAYLLRVIDPQHHGVHKRYDAVRDAFEPRLHTIYTASTVFTLLKLHEAGPDPDLLVRARQAAGFLLGQQSRDSNQPTYGGFFYSYDLQTRAPEPKLVVGTASKTIFTLLQLSRVLGDDSYLDAAVLAGQWLLSMQTESGHMQSVMRRAPDGRWMTEGKESLLYSGQVLSALSRLYHASGRTDLFEAATRLAGILMDRVARLGCYLGDDYRGPNPISSSWVILGLWDYLKISQSNAARAVVQRCARDLLERQIRTADDLFQRGRWHDSLSSSGVGWLAEVYSELYLYCLDDPMWDCNQLKEAVIEALRQLVQHTYTPESAFVVRNPDRADGGLFWSVGDRSVRTDSVCHAMNAYLNMRDHLAEGSLLSIPEPPLARALSLTP